MRKILLIIAMLSAVSPVMAGVTITAVVEAINELPDGNQSATIRVGYTGDIHVRAFALDINVDNGCTFGNIRDFNVGENTGVKNGYGIFPGRFRQFVNPANPSWGDANANSNYNPTPPWGDPGTTGTGIGYNKIIVEMAYMGAGDANRPPLSGTLFRVDVNAYSPTRGDVNLTISADALRGGVIDTDTNATTTATNLPAGIVIHFSPTCLCVTPLIEIGAARAMAEAAWTGQGYTLGCGTGVVDCSHLGVIITQDSDIYPLPYCIHYTYGIAPTEPNCIGLTREQCAAALTAIGFTMGPDINGFGGSVPIGRIYAQIPAPGTQTCSGSLTPYIASYPIKVTAPNSMYYNWAALGKPSCWAYPRQCRGDALSKKAGIYWVNSNDLVILKSAFNKAQSAIPPGGICADSDHRKAGLYWVGSNDLATLKLYLNKAESFVPVCGTGGVSDANFWYLCVPVGVTCPTGVTCATPGVCPNTP